MPQLPVNRSLAVVVMSTWQRGCGFTEFVHCTVVVTDE